MFKVSVKGIFQDNQSPVIEQAKSLGQKSNNSMSVLQEGKINLCLKNIYSVHFFFSFALSNLEDEKKAWSQTKIYPRFSTS